MMSRSPQCYIPSFVEISPPVLEKIIFEGFLSYMGVAVSEEIIFEGFLSYMGVAVSEEKTFENVNGRRRTTDGQTTTDAGSMGILYAHR